MSATVDRAVELEAKVGLGLEPMADYPLPHSRHIPAKVKRAVWNRDDGQCAFVSRNGRRCTARTFIEYHHVKPFAAGGEATVENIQLRCRAHNGYEAELYFGESWVSGSWVRECIDELVSNRVEVFQADNQPLDANGPPV